MMRRFQNDPYTLRLEDLVNRIGNLRRHFFLDQYRWTLITHRPRPPRRRRETRSHARFEGRRQKQRSAKSARPYFFAAEPPEGFAFKNEVDVAVGFGFSAFGFFGSRLLLFCPLAMIASWVPVEVSRIILEAADLGVATDKKGSPKTTGTVKFYNSARGFGFIQPDDGGEDVFVHVTALERAGMHDLVEGQKVSFDVEADRRTGKTTATNIREEWPRGAAPLVA
jgi:CspA family cold shock protein